MASWLPEWDGAGYAANTSHHRRYDEDFLRSTPLRPDARVLDLGCGPGDFTVRLAERVPAGHVVGLDPQPSMLELARAVARPNQSFVLGTAQRLGELTGPFDAIVSRAVLHWIPIAEHPAVLAAAAGLLAPGGLLRIEAGGGDNVREPVRWLDEISARHGGPRSPWSFPQAGEYLDLVLAAGFDVREGWVRLAAQRREFDRDAFVGWVTSQALHAYTHTMAEPAAAAFRAEALAGVDRMRHRDGSYDMTWVRLDVRAFRPNSRQVPK